MSAPVQIREIGGFNSHFARSSGGVGQTPHPSAFG
jgi:hypothetical protein